MLSGLKDKLYWRPWGSVRLWCCFKRCGGRPGYVSLCGGHAVLRVGGQKIARPVSWLRCANCDVAEMGRREWEEGGVESRDWRSFCDFKGVKAVAPAGSPAALDAIFSGPVAAGEGRAVAGDAPRIAGATHEEDLQLLREVVRHRDETLRRLEVAERLLARTQPILKQAQQQIDEMHRELTKMQVLHGMDQPWPTRDVLAKLSEAAKILLHHHSYDSMGWEQIDIAVRAADATVRRFDELRDAPGSPVGAETPCG